MKISRKRIIFLAGALLLVTLSCSLFGVPPPSAGPVEPVSPTSTRAAQALPSTQAPEPQSSEAPPQEPAPVQPPAEATPASTAQPEAPSAQAGEDCAEAVCIQSGSFLLERPIGEQGRFTIDTSSRYGTLNKKTRLMYHGVQFLNSTGTPVLAAAEGEVVVAGDDSQTAYGLQTNTYGNLVILQHSLPGIAETVYTLYAHLSEVAVKEGDTVESGQEIGQVGMTGSVFGSTLYFEVRVGENTYAAARNPELWLSLLPDADNAATGALAGRVVDASGEYLPVANILVEPTQKSVQRLIKPLYLKTYLERQLRGQGPWKESFAAASLPEGSYQVSFWHNSILYERIVEVQPGMLTFVTLQVK